MDRRYLVLKHLDLHFLTTQQVRVLQSQSKDQTATSIQRLQITVTLADRSTITDTTEADTEEGSSEAETQEPQVQMQKAQ